MKFSAMHRLVAAAFALVALTSSEAFAQYTPTLSVTATGNSVTIEWTPIAGALGYTLVAGTAAGQADIAIVNLPASVTRVVVSAPNGAYFLRVRAFAGPLSGPFSNEASVNVGLQPCVPGVAAVVTATPAGSFVDVSWTPVPGAAAYHVQWSRYSGGTELAEVATTTSLRKFVGVVGTYYVRVAAVTACGMTTSEEVAFTLDLMPIGPRTPNPEPGGRLPMPNHFPVVEFVAAERPDLYANVCNSLGFIDRVLARLREIDTRYGYACKGGTYSNGTCHDVLHDVISYNWSDELDEGTRKLYSFDIVIGSSSCPPSGLGWNNTQPGPDYIGRTVWTSRGRW
jgi:hypothetical protein